MVLHRNAKLGLAGRLALVEAIERGMSMKAAAAAFSVSPATAHRWWHRWREASEPARASLACLLDRSSRPHHSPHELAPSCRSGSAPAGERRAGDHGCSRRSPASPTQPSGKCSSGRASPGPSARRESLPTATSGHAPATCCTSTSAATPASSAPAMPSPEIAPRAGASRCTRRGSSATTSRTRSSTTTRASPTSGSIATSGQRP